MNEKEDTMIYEFWNELVNYDKEKLYHSYIITDEELDHCLGMKENLSDFSFEDCNWTELQMKVDDILKF